MNCTRARTPCWLSNGARGEEKPEPLTQPRLSFLTNPALGNSLPRVYPQPPTGTSLRPVACGIDFGREPNKSRAGAGPRGSGFTRKTWREFHRRHGHGQMMDSLAHPPRYLESSIPIDFRDCKWLAPRLEPHHITDFEHRHTLPCWHRNALQRVLVRFLPGARTSDRSVATPQRTVSRLGF